MFRLRVPEDRKLSRACGPVLAGARDPAVLLLGFAGALRRSELVGLDIEHVTWTGDGLKLLIERSKTDAQGEGAGIAIPPGGQTTPFQSPPSKPDCRGVVERARLSTDAVRQIF